MAPLFGVVAKRKEVGLGALIAAIRSGVVGAAAGSVSGVLLVLLWGIFKGYIPLLPNRWRPKGLDFRWWRRNEWSEEEIKIFRTMMSRGGVPKFGLPQQRNFITPAGSSHAVPQYMWFEAEKRLRGLVHIGQETCGTGGGVHGGCLTAVLDEALGIASYWSTRRYCVTRNLTMKFGNDTLAPGTTVEVEAWFDKREDRKIFVQASAKTLDNYQQGDDTPICEGSAVFMDVSGKDV